MDTVYKGPLRHTTALKDLPSTYFRRQCWISADPDEKALGAVIDFVGADRFFWASDFPHPDHGDNYVEGEIFSSRAAFPPQMFTLSSRERGRTFPIYPSGSASPISAG